jgi:hypothetical protein
MVATVACGKADRHLRTLRISISVSASTHGARLTCAQRRADVAEHKAVGKVQKGQDAALEHVVGQAEQRGGRGRRGRRALARRRRRGQRQRSRRQQQRRLVGHAQPPCRSRDAVCQLAQLRVEALEQLGHHGALDEDAAADARAAAAAAVASRGAAAVVATAAVAFALRGARHAKTKMAKIPGETAMSSNARNGRGCEQPRAGGARAPRSAVRYLSVQRALVRIDALALCRRRRPVQDDEKCVLYVSVTHGVKKLPRVPCWRPAARGPVSAPRLVRSLRALSIAAFPVRIHQITTTRM